MASIFKKTLSLLLVAVLVLVVHWVYYSDLFVFPRPKIDRLEGLSYELVAKTQQSAGLHNSLLNATDTERRVLLIVGIVSAPSRPGRRQAIRQTWLQTCSHHQHVVCRFFTDSLSDVDRASRPAMLQESAKFKDIEFMSVPRGLNFGLRMLWLLDWSVRHFDFEFLLRVDDDYFVCLERFIKELEFRKAQRLYWGFLHCKNEGQVRVDEAFLVLSHSVVRSVLSRRDDLFCSPFGDQSLAMWLKKVPDVTFFHDPRLVHTGNFTYVSALCHRYLGLHHIYQQDAAILWDKVKTEKIDGYEVPAVIPFEKLCKHSKVFDWRSMVGEYRYKPDLCNNKPVWKDMKMWGGKGGSNRLHWSKKRIILPP